MVWCEIHHTRRSLLGELWLLIKDDKIKVLKCRFGFELVSGVLLEIEKPLCFSGSMLSPSVVDGVQIGLLTEDVPDAKNDEVLQTSTHSPFYSHFYSQFSSGHIV